MTVSKSDNGKKKSTWIIALLLVAIAAFAFYAIHYLSAECPVIPDGKEVIVCNVTYRTTVITDDSICQEIKTMLMDYQRENIRNTKPMRAHAFDILMMVNEKPWHIAVDQDSAILYGESAKYSIINSAKLYEQLSEIVLGGTENET